MSKLQLITSIASSKEIITKALKIAFVVGIILNMINQGEKIVGLVFNDINYYKFFLTFLVPFSVSMYTAISMKLKFQVGEKAVENALLKCTNCNNCLKIQKEQTIPFCEKCKDKTKWKVTSIKNKNCQHNE